MGRPPNDFTKEEVIQLGKELVAWISSDEGKSGIQWVNWYYFKHGLFREDWKLLIQREDFQPYYKIARQIMAQNITLNTKIAQSYGNRYLHRYDDELGADEEAARDRDAQRGSIVNQNINVEQLSALAACLEKFSQKKQISTDTTTVEGHTATPPETVRDPEDAQDP